MKIFQERLIEQRKLNEMTQRQLADYLEISQPSYIRYEKGTAEPSFENLVKILWKIYKTESPALNLRPIAQAVPSIALLPSGCTVIS